MARHHAAHPALLGALAAAAIDNPTTGGTSLAALANPNTPVAAIDAGLARWATRLRAPRPPRLAAGGTLTGAVVALEPAARGAHQWGAFYSAFPQAREELAASALTGDTSDTQVLTMILADTSLPGSLRQAAARQLLNGADRTPTVPVALKQLTQFTTEHPHLARKAGRGLPIGHAFAQVLRHRALGWNGSDLPQRAASLVGNYNEITWCWELARAGERGTALTDAVINHPDADAKTLEMLAGWPTLPVAVRGAAAARTADTLTRPSRVHVVLNLLEEPECPDTLLDAALAAASNDYQLNRILYSILQRPQVCPQAVDVVLGSGIEMFLSLVAAHPGVDAGRRQLATDLSSAQPGSDDHMTIAAGRHLPDLAAAGAAMPLKMLTGLVPCAFEPLRDAALAVLLGQVSTSDHAQVLVALAPTFPGTLEELFATVATIAA